jgi:hypothetical protein
VVPCGNRVRRAVSHICAGTGLTPPTSATGLRSPLPHLRQDCATSTLRPRALYMRASIYALVRMHVHPRRQQHIGHASWPSADRRAPVAHEYSGLLVSSQGRAPVAHEYSGLLVSSQGRAPVPHEARATARSSSMLEPIEARNPNVEKEYE